MAGTWWFVDEDDSIRATTRANEAAIIMCTEDLGSRFVLSGRIRQDGAQGGAIVLESAGRQSMVWVMFSPGLVDVPGRSRAVQGLPAGEVEFACVFDGGFFGVGGDGKRVIRMFNLDRPFHDACRIGLGVPFEGGARFTKLRARRLAEGEKLEAALAELAPEDGLPIELP